VEEYQSDVAHTNYRSLW